MLESSKDVLAKKRALKTESLLKTVSVLTLSIGIHKVFQEPIVLTD